MGSVLTISIPLTNLRKRGQISESLGKIPHLTWQP